MSWKMPGVEFDAPSDFVDDGGGGGSKRWLKIAGLGCGGLLLILALLFGVGAFKIVSCCGDIKAVGENTTRASALAIQFGEHVQRERWQEAHALLTPEHAEALSQDALAEKFASHRDLLDGATPLLENVRADGIDGEQVESTDQLRDINSWTVRVRFFPEAKKEQLIARIGVAQTSEASGDEPSGLGVSAISLERRPIDVRAEPPARTVLELHGFLQSDNLPRAFSLLDLEMQQQGQAKFKGFIEDQGELFTRSTMEINQVSYASSQQAQVVAKLQAASGKKAIVTYELRPLMGTQWRVTAITPLVETTDDAPPAPAEEEPPPEEGSADDAQEGSGDTPEPPAEEGEK